MKKLLVSVYIALTGLSAQAMVEEGINLQGEPVWQYAEHPADAERLARAYYASLRQLVLFKEENLKLAMERFGGAFLTWKFGHEGKTIIHCLALKGTPEALSYALGFFPNGIDDLKDNQGLPPYADHYKEKMLPWSFPTLEAHRKNPRSHPPDILKLRDKPAPSSESLFSNLFNKKAAGILATLVAFGLFYRYKSNKDNKPSASAD